MIIIIIIIIIIIMSASSHQLIENRTFSRTHHPQQSELLHPQQFHQGHNHLDTLHNDLTAAVPSSGATKIHISTSRCICITAYI